MTDLNAILSRQDAAPTNKNRKQVVKHVLMLTYVGVAFSHDFCTLRFETAIRLARGQNLGIGSRFNCYNLDPLMVNHAKSTFAN